MLLKKGEKVKVIVGKDKGKNGEIIYTNDPISGLSSLLSITNELLYNSDYVFIEWADLIPSILPKETIYLKFEHFKNWNSEILPNRGFFFFVNFFFVKIFFLWKILDGEG